MNRLKLDLSAFGSEYRLPELSQAAFDLKIYGTFRHRYLALTCQKCESSLLRQLRITTDKTVSDVLVVLKDSLVIIVIQFLSFYHSFVSSLTVGSLCFLNVFICLYYIIYTCNLYSCSCSCCCDLCIFTRILL